MIDYTADSSEGKAMIKLVVLVCPFKLKINFFKLGHPIMTHQQVAQVILIQLADDYAENLGMLDADVPPEALRQYETIPTVHVRFCLQWPSMDTACIGGWPCPTRHAHQTSRTS